MLQFFMRTPIQQPLSFGPAMAFTRCDLEADGFDGWLTFAETRAALDHVPRAQGVYVVVGRAEAPAAFTEISCAGWFKGRDPSVRLEQLSANWVDGAEVLYIGKADRLRRRVREFADLMAGKPAAHWGGRLVGQLPTAPTLLVAWKVTPDQSPRQVEKELIRSFRGIYGKPPFANDPHRRGL